MRPVAYRSQRYLRSDHISHAGFCQGQGQFFNFTQPAMYSDGEAHDAPQTQRKIPPASSMLWVRNLRRFIGSGAGLGSEALMGSYSFLSISFSFVISINYYFITYIHYYAILQNLKQKESCLTFLKISRRKALKLVQSPVSTRRHVKQLIFSLFIVIIMHV